MRIAFISANRETMPDAVIPLGVLSVMAATPGHHEKIFWDLCFEADPLGTVARNLRESQPYLVAIGLRNLQNMNYTNITSNLDAYRALIQAARANSSAPIVLGGGGFSATPQAGARRAHPRFRGRTRPLRRSDARLGGGQRSREPTD